MTTTDTIRIGVYPRRTGRIIVAPLHLGIHQGYFADVDVEVKICEPEDHPWHALGRGEIDCGLSYIDYPTWDGLRGKLVAVAVHEQYTQGRGMTCLLARTELFESGRISDDPGSIKGLRIGLLPGRGDDHLCFRGVLDQADLTFDDVQRVPVPHGGAARRSWIADGAVDVIIGRRPASIADELETGRVRLWKGGDDIYRDFQARFWAANTDFLASSRDVLVRWLHAYGRATAEVLDSYARAAAGDIEGIRLIGELTGEPVERLLAVKPVGYSETGAIDTDRLETEVAKLREADLFPADCPVSAVLDLTCLQDAAGVQSV